MKAEPRKIPVIQLTKKISLKVGGQSINAIIAGNVGSGKTYLLIDMILQLISQGNICYVADMKGGQGGDLYSLIKDNAKNGDLFAINTPERFEEVLTQFLKEVKNRINYLKTFSKIGMTAVEVGFPTLLLVVDEYSTGIAILKRSADSKRREMGKRIDEKLMTLVSQARQASIGVFFSFQYFTADVLPKAVEAECTLIGMGNLDKQLAINLFGYEKDLPRFDYSKQGAGLIKKPQDNEPKAFQARDLSGVDLRAKFEEVSHKNEIPSSEPVEITYEGETIAQL